MFKTYSGQMQKQYLLDQTSTSNAPTTICSKTGYLTRVAKRSIPEVIKS